MSSSDRYPFRTAEPETDCLIGTITGTGAADPTMDSALGNGFAVTWISTGLYEITLSQAVQRVVPARPAFWATTLTDVDGWDVVFKAYNATTRKIRFSVINESRTLSDLPAATGLHLTLNVKKTTVHG